MDIKIHNDTITEIFPKGEIVFKIQAIQENNTTKDIYMVTEYEDVLKKLKTHQYTPLLYLVPFTTKLAYLYGCLNLSFDKKKSEQYVFYWRKIGTQSWDTWFTVLPYNDAMF